MNLGNNKIAISVIIPVYNVERYLKKCVSSVLNQTFKDYEIIIVNDGSTDNSQNIIDSFVDINPQQIKAFIKENGGLSSARNYGIKKANGKYITFLDSDDYIDFDYLETLYKVAEENQSDMVCGGQRKVADNDSVIATLKYPLDKNPNTILRRLNISGKLYRKDYIERLNLEFAVGKTYEDDPFNLRAIFMANNLKLISYEGYNQLVREGSITSKKIENHKIPYNALEETIKYVTTHRTECNDYSVFQYTVLSFFTYFIFQANKSHAYLKQSKNRQSNVDVVLEFCDYSIEMLRKYMPDYCRNEHLGLFKNKDLQLKQRVGTLGYVVLCRTRLLKLMTRLYYKI